MNASPYLLIISVIILSIAKADQVPEFSVEGELSNQYFEKGVLVGSGVNRFTVSVVGCQSLIRIDRKGKGGIQYDEFGCPGTNSFTVRVYGPLAMGDAMVKLFNPKTGQLEEVGDALNKKSLMMRPWLSILKSFQITQRSSSRRFGWPTLPSASFQQATEMSIFYPFTHWVKTQLREICLRLNGKRHERVGNETTVCLAC